MRGFVIAIVGAESTGKTSLARALFDALTAVGEDAVVVDESLRTFCSREGRTPRQDEQRAIAELQSERIDAAASEHAVVIADTTALMTAIYSAYIFQDHTLDAYADAQQRRCGCTLLTALDLPWRADGLQRDGAHVREPIDALVCAALARAGVTFERVHGRGDARVTDALAALRRSPFGQSATGARSLEA